MLDALQHRHNLEERVAWVPLNVFIEKVWSHRQFARISYQLYGRRRIHEQRRVLCAMVCRQLTNDRRTSATPTKSARIYSSSPPLVQFGPVGAIHNPDTLNPHRLFGS